MGILCSCIRGPDEQDDILSNNLGSQQNKQNIFSQGQTSAASTSNQQALTSDESREKQAKGTRDSRVQPEPDGPSDALLHSKSIQESKTLISKEHHSESSAKALSPAVHGTAYSFPSPDDEDVCPTCLEEYSEENPKIKLKCSHYYHLSCTYEWMERSENCPICGKLMLFNESKHGTKIGS